LAQTSKRALVKDWIELRQSNLRDEAHRSNRTLRAFVTRVCRLAY
jgi:hypothetical protein